MHVLTNLLLLTLSAGAQGHPASQESTLEKRDQNFIAAFTDPNCNGKPIDPPATAPGGEVPPCFVFNSHGDHGAHVGINWPTPPANDNIHVFIGYSDDKCTKQVFWYPFMNVDTDKGTQRCLSSMQTNGTWGSVNFT